MPLHTPCLVPQTRPACCQIRGQQSSLGACCSPLSCQHQSTHVISKRDGGHETGCNAVQEEAAEDLGPLLQGVLFAALDSHDEGLLWDVCSRFVVMYDPDIAFIRQLEV